MNKVCLFVLSISLTLNAKSVTYKVTPLLTDPDNGLEMLNGKTIKFKSTLSNGMEVLFEDLHPGANWGHPARFKVVTKDKKVLESVETNQPPRGLNEDTPVVEGEELNVVGTPEFKISDLSGKHRVSDPSHYYAVLINGMADQRHWNDFSFLYRVLVQIYGYNPQNIYVADSRFKTKLPDLDGNGTEDIQFLSTGNGVRELIETLKYKVKHEDQVLVAINDHGSTTGTESTIVLYDGEMKASEFGALLNGLPAQRILSIYEQCYSGGFVRPSVNQTRVSMAAATDKEFSWASMDLKFDEFIYHVIAAFAMQTYDGKPVHSDLDGNGRVTALEAYTYAVGNDLRQESPLLEAHNNTGYSRVIGLN